MRNARIVALLGLAGVLLAGTGAGDLDLGFGSDGFVLGDPGQVWAVLVQSDGKTIAVGEDHGGASDRWAVRRYDTDGSLDTGFGTGGTVLLFGDNGDDRAVDVALDGSGRIVVAGDVLRASGKGKKQSFSRSIAVVRLDANGSLDTGFGSGGVAYGSPEQARAVALQADGKIVVASAVSASSGGGGRGKKGGTSSQAFALVRFTSGGSLDTSFGTDGVAVDDVSTGDDWIWFGALAVQGDGKILAGGRGTDAWIVARYAADGSLDTGFGTSGHVIGGPDGDERLTGLAIQSDGKIVVSGWGSDGAGGFDAVVARYGTAGTLDTGFGTSGAASSGLADNDFGQAIAIQSDGKIVVSLEIEPGSTVPPIDLAVWRLTGAGAADTSFGTGGTSGSPDARDADFPRGGLALDPNGGIVVGGFANGALNNDPKWLVVRYCD